MSIIKVYFKFLPKYIIKLVVNTLANWIRFWGFNANEIEQFPISGSWTLTEFKNRLVHWADKSIVDAILIIRNILRTLKALKFPIANKINRFFKSKVFICVKLGCYVLISGWTKVYHALPTLYVNFRQIIKNIFYFSKFTSIKLRFILKWQIFPNFSNLTYLSVWILNLWLKIINLKLSFERSCLLESNWRRVGLMNLHLFWIVARSQFIKNKTWPFFHWWNSHTFTTL